MRRARLLLLVTGVAFGVCSGPVGAWQGRVNPHGTIPEGLDCSACHTNEGWLPVRDSLDFEHGARSGFVLSGAHRQVACAGCHLDLRFDGPEVGADDCASCHADVHQGRMMESCASCHTTRSFDAVDGEAVHARTTFPLTGAHRQVTCESCHVDDVGGAFTALPTDCVSCHRTDYRGAQAVDHVSAGYPTTCTECHSTVGWSDAPAFDHATVSGGFTLVGAHDHLRCSSCHRSPGMEPIFAAVSQGDCASCHGPDYDREHAGSGFPKDCTSCHTIDTWSGADFDHAETGFALLGSHDRLQCTSCHSEGDRALRFPTPADQDDCASCHRGDYDHEHAGSGFPLTCQSCHGLDRWEGTSFDHASTGFPLVGAHEPTACVDCHGSPAHLSTLPAGPEDCVACHQVDYDEGHGGSTFPTTCMDCHDQGSWENADFDHVALSEGFVLEGAHATSECSVCHSVPDYGLLFPEPSDQNDCVACHQVEFDQEHSGSGYPTTCLSCHAPDQWEGATFDHGTTAFPLVGAHAPADCSSCHGPPGHLSELPSGPRDCVACHQADYDQEHAGSDFPMTCLECHNQGSWEGADIDHVAVSGGFALRGPHATAQCSVCHSQPDYALLFPEPSNDNDCVACHQADYDGEHAGSGFPTSCRECHDQSSWEGATVDHAAVSGGFVLNGPHATAACTACHSVPDYALLFPEPSNNNDCVSCHQADFDREHAGSGFPTTCLTCHQSNTWSGATLDHPSISGGFRLLGAHATAECTACHTIPGYGLRFPDPANQNDCVACHQTEYDREHGGSGYPTDCTACHTMNAWQPSTFDHDASFFPIYSGSHRGKWDSCNECHLGGNLSDFTCTTCHTQSNTNGDHREVRDYVFESHACFSCHPRGRGD